MLVQKSPAACDGEAQVQSVSSQTLIAPESPIIQDKIDLSIKAETLEYARRQIELGKQWCAMRLGNFSLSADARWPLLNASTIIEVVRYSALPLPGWQAAVDVVRHSLRISHHREALENAERRFANADRGW
jgi:hypothetical protein